MFIKPQSTAHRAHGGFTIVELLVAAVILLITVAAVVAVVRQSTELQLTDLHRRQARAAIIKHFETTFAFNRFSKSGQYNVVEGDESVTVNVVSGGWSTPIPLETPLDDKGGCSEESISFRAVSDPAYSVPVHIITIRVNWLETGAETPESIELTKRLAYINE